MANIVYNQPMDRYLSWRSGGVVKVFYTPNNIKELAQFLKHNTQPIAFLGLGSNLLIKDEGFNGVIIHTKQFNNLQINKNSIIADAGVPLAKIARLCCQNNLYGAEFLSTIPGSLGGGLAMNAGCFGYEIWYWVKQVQTIDNKGDIHNRNVDDFKIGYREVIANYPNEYFISAVLKFSPSAKKTQIKTLLDRRRKTQPVGLASCGSVFKNPPGYYAGTLIEQAGLKGFCVGKACVSHKHANFIINTGNASTSDIQKLIKHIQKVIKRQHHITLETEVSIL